MGELGCGSSRMRLIAAKSLWTSATAFLIGADAQASSRALTNVSRQRYYLLLVVLLSAALVFQLGVYALGVYSASADESARAIIAHDYSLAQTLAPSSWPPFNKVVTGIALWLHDDLFVTPRILSNLFGLVVILAVAQLAYRLFDNRLIAIVAAALAVFVPQRLILSAAPLSDISAYFFCIFAASYLVTWLKTGKLADLTIASCILLVGATVRYESWFFNAVLACYLAYRTFVGLDVSLRTFLLNGAILAAFPIVWLASTYLQTGTLGAIGTTSRQFIDAYGLNYFLALRYSALSRFVLDVLINPALAIGAITLVAMAVRDWRVRDWALVMFSPLLIISALMLATFSVPMAAPFRIDGQWLLLLVPFASFAIVNFAQRIATGADARWPIYGVVAGLVYVFVLPAALAAKNRVDLLAHEVAVIRPADIELGRKLSAVLAGDRQHVLLDAIDNVDFLNVIVVANAPGRFVLNVDADISRTALYATGRKAYLARGDDEIVSKYLTDKFRIGDRLDTEKLRLRNIGYVLLRKTEGGSNYPQGAALIPLGDFGRWSLFSLNTDRSNVAATAIHEGTLP
jgi:hypothetical protein